METEESRPGVPETRFESFEDFWPFYLGEHRHPLNRRLHVVGTTLALGTLIGLCLVGLWYLIGLVLVIGYAFAWVGHFLIEKNRPATFSYPLYSFIGDFKMWGLACSGRLGTELEKHGIQD